MSLKPLKINQGKKKRIQSIPASASEREEKQGMADLLSALVSNIFLIRGGGDDGLEIINIGKKRRGLMCQSISIALPFGVMQRRRISQRLPPFQQLPQPILDFLLLSAGVTSRRRRRPGIRAGITGIHRWATSQYAAAQRDESKEIDANQIPLVLVRVAVVLVVSCRLVSCWRMLLMPPTHALQDLCIPRNVARL
jgi:hypothetical protein